MTKRNTLKFSEIHAFWLVRQNSWALEGPEGLASSWTCSKGDACGRHSLWYEVKLTGWFGMAGLQAIMDYCYLADHLSSSWLDFNSNHMLWVLWILDCLSVLHWSHVYMPVWANYNNIRENCFCFSSILPTCTCMYKHCNQLNQLGQCFCKVGT